MITFTLQSLDWLLLGHRHYFVLFFIYAWLVWSLKAVFALQYRTFTKPYTTTTSVVIPVVDEPEELFFEVLQRIVTQNPTEIIVVINGQRNVKLEQICDWLGVYWEWTPQAGKRNALKLGVAKARGDIVLLVDSDTFWTPGTLSELVKPFADPKVGGVTTHQRIWRPDRNLLTRFADWLEDVRTKISMPAMSVFGQVGCLPGRTIAFRRDILERAMPQFLTEKFLGIHLEVSDDRSLTNYTLMMGYRTVYQRSSVVYTDAPTNLKRFIKQQYRWAKGSQYNTIRMLPWMVRHTPFLAFVYVTDILTPFFLCGLMLANIYQGMSSASPNLLHELFLGSSPQVLVMLGSMTLSIGLRQMPHFFTNRRDLLILPAFVLLLTFLMTPVRMWGFVMMARDSSWGTRPNAYLGGAPADPRTRDRMTPVWQALPFAAALGLIVVFTAVGLLLEVP